MFRTGPRFCMKARVVAGFAARTRIAPRPEMLTRACGPLVAELAAVQPSNETIR